MFRYVSICISIYRTNDDSIYLAQKTKERQQYYTITNAIKRDEMKWTSVMLFAILSVFVLDIVIYMYIL